MDGGQEAIRVGPASGGFVHGGRGNRLMARNYHFAARSPQVAGCKKLRPGELPSIAIPLSLIGLLPKIAPGCVRFHLRQFGVASGPIGPRIVLFAGHADNVQQPTVCESLVALGCSRMTRSSCLARIAVPLSRAVERITVANGVAYRSKWSGLQRRDVSALLS
jgi:hypothetical protein